MSGESFLYSKYKKLLPNIDYIRAIPNGSTYIHAGMPVNDENPISSFVIMYYYTKYE